MTDVADPRYASAVAAIDAANAEDPNVVVVDGVARPKELLHAEVVERWVRTLDPSATDLQLLAARAHHLRRWVVPRSDYPAGRAGYLRWRTDHKARQADEVATIVRSAGYGPEDVARVAALVGKRTPKGDAAGQVHEDALCLAFVELQFDDVVAQLGHDHAVSVVRKTLRKMSPDAIARAAAMPLSPASAAVLVDAVAPTGDGAGDA
ncbi:MAG: DUF4202 domain-containing protein [Acidimicrobiales bacterium]